MSAKRKAENHSKGSNRPRVTKPTGSRADSERDSGFSDASSEHMGTMRTTDMEDSLKPGVQKGSQSAASGQQPSQLAVVGGSYSGLSPMIIMNNVLLKQSPGDPPPALKPWSFSPTVEVVQPVVQHPQVVFLQPVVSRQASPASTETTSRHRRQKKYLPILKSYPKIAPHPGDSASSSGRGTASSSSSSSSSSSGSEKGSLAPNARDHCQREKQQRSASTSGSNTPSLPGTPGCMSPQLQNQLSVSATDAGGSGGLARERPPSALGQTELLPSLSFAHTAGSKNQTLPAPWTVAQDQISARQSDHCDGDADSKRKRFCNTYNILSKSGLLDITLRTKELLRQNRRTQSDLERLKQNTDLFLQALRCGDSGICMKLQASLQEEDREKEKERALQAGVKAD